MTDRFEAFRSRFSGASPPSEAELRQAFEPHLAVGESVKHRLAPSKLVCEDDEETQVDIVAEDGTALIVVTDQKILFTIVSPDDEWILDVPYTDVRNVDVKTGLLRSTLVVDSWTTGTCRVRTSDSDSLTEAVTYIREATHCWQSVLKKIQAATERLSALSDHLEDGRLGEVHETREKIRAKLDQANAAVEDAEIESIPVLVDRIAETRAELHRTEIYARLTRATTLMTEAQHMTDSRAYTGAYQRYWDARDHLENARMLARQVDIEEPAVIDGHLEEIETHIENLRVRPLALAKQARERAETTEKLDVRIEALEQAFEHYRDALTAGWGTDYEFAGEKDHIRMQIELVVRTLVGTHREMAEQCIRRGDGYRANGDIMSAWRAYEQAADHVEDGKQLAREFHASNPEEFAELEARLTDRL